MLKGYPLLAGIPTDYRAVFVSFLLSKMETDGPRKRKPNFTYEELVILLNEVARDKMTIMSRFQTWNTHRQKKEVWRRISENVNVCGVAYRTHDDVKNKWKELKASALHSLRNHAKTGVGAPGKPRLSAPYFGDLVLSIVGDDRSGPAGPIEG